MIEYLEQEQQHLEAMLLYLDERDYDAVAQTARQWLDEVIVEIEQFNDDMDEQYRIYLNEKLMLFGGMKN